MGPFIGEIGQSVPQRGYERKTPTIRCTQTGLARRGDLASRRKVKGENLLLFTLLALIEMTGRSEGTIDAWINLDGDTSRVTSHSLIVAMRRSTRH